MISYRKIMLQDKAWIQEKLNESDYRGSEYCFGNQYLWGSLLDMEAAEVEGTLCTRYRKSGSRAMHDFPAGEGDLWKAMREVIKEDERMGDQSIFRGITEEQKKEMESIFPGAFLYESRRGEWDYLYPVDALQMLEGKRYHKKRNHISRFREGGSWSYEAMSEENIEDCRQMYHNWLEMNRERLDESVEKEKHVVKGCFDHFRELELEGGVLRREGEVAGFCIGSGLNSDTYIVHVEKAYTQVQGAYPMLNQQFVLHNMQGYQFVNREDDLGLEGLRRAKMSYYPQPLLEKYQAELVKREGI